jgi:hypothetical protein
MASSSAACVFGVARLISSASTTFAKTGPRSKVNSRPEPASRMISVPVTSAGIRSGVFWMRENSRSVTSETVRISDVFPSPGLPSSRAFPSHSMQASTCSRTAS